MKNFKKSIISIMLFIVLVLSGCTKTDANTKEVNIENQEDNTSLPVEGNVEDEGTWQQEENTEVSNNELGSFSLDQIADYSGTPYTFVNDNIPYFTEDDYTTEIFETYSELDNLGRCGVAYANICVDIMPTEDREAIGQVKPSGWHTYKYDFVDGKYLYNRCHLIGFQLAGENANEKNLITGTRYLNVDGMLPFENMVADYVKETDNHVLYRVTPVYNGDDLVATGVLMEAYSIEDEGDGICFNVFVYNVQPGVTIDYKTGESWETETENKENEEKTEYVVNTNSKKFHYPDCSGAEKISESNRDTFTGTRETLIEQGYEPCGICKP